MRVTLNVTIPQGRVLESVLEAAVENADLSGDLDQADLLDRLRDSVRKQLDA